MRAIESNAHQIAASKSSGSYLVWLMADCGGIDRREEEILGMSAEFAQTGRCYSS